MPDVTAPPPPRIAGLTEPTVPPIERVAIRLRESSVTLAAWRLAASAAEGSGALVRVETPGGTLFRGEGWFLGWTQDAMSESLGRAPPHAALRCGRSWRSSGEQRPRRPRRPGEAGLEPHVAALDGPEVERERAQLVHLGHRPGVEREVHRLHVAVARLAGLHPRRGMRLALPAREAASGSVSPQLGQRMRLVCHSVPHSPQPRKRAAPSEPGISRRNEMLGGAPHIGHRPLPGSRGRSSATPRVDQRLGVGPEHRVREKVLTLLGSPGPGGAEASGEEVRRLGAAGARGLPERHRTRLGQEAENRAERRLDPQHIPLQRPAQRVPAMRLEHAGGGAGLRPEQPGGEAQRLAPGRRRFGERLGPGRSVLESLEESLSAGCHRSRRGTRPGGAGAPRPW